MTTRARGRLPELIIVGTAKAGTSALHAMLAKHPDVYMSDPKEPHFFAYEGHALDFGGPADQAMMRHMTVTDIEAYEALFRGRSEPVVGEASAMYLYVQGTAERMASYVPDAHLVVVLRDPVARAYSAFQHLRRDGREPLADFGEALRAEPERTRDGWIPLWHYRAMGLYTRQLERYFEYYPRDRVQVFLYEDLCADPAGLVASVFKAVGVDPRVEVETRVERNVSGIARSAAAQRLLMRPNAVKDALKPLIPASLRERGMARLKRLNVRPAPTIPQEVEAELRGFYAQDVRELARLIGRDLSGWLPRP